MKLENKIKKLETLNYPVHEMTLSQIQRTYNMIITYRISEPYELQGAHPAYKGSAPGFESEEIPISTESIQNRNKFY